MTPLPSVTDQLRHRSMTAPLLLAVVVLLLGSHSALTASGLSWANDEPAHLGYVGALARGELPTVDSPIDTASVGEPTDGIRGRTAAHDDIWTANHAPLFHALFVPLWWAGTSQETLVDALRLVNVAGFAAWLVNVAGFAAWLVLVALIAGTLLPARPLVPGLAAAAALTPSLLVRSSYAMNDGLSAAAGLLVVLLTLRMIRGRASPALLLAAAAAGTVAAGTRATGVLVVAVCALGLAAVGLRRSGPRGALAGLAVVGGVPAVLTGWFYLRNLSLYGDVTGQDALLTKFGRTPPGGLAGVWNDTFLDGAVLTAILPTTALVLGTTLLLADRLRGGIARPVDGAWLVVGGLTLLVGINVVRFLSTGGWFHDRYLMPMMPGLASVAAVGIIGLRRTPGAERAAAVAGTALLMMWCLGLWWSAVGVPDLTDADGPPVIATLLPGVVASALGIAVVRATWQVGTRAIASDPVASAGQLSAEPSA